MLFGLHTVTQANERPLIDLRPAGPPASAAPAVPAAAAPLTLQRIQDYVWARYVDYRPAPAALDEDEALAYLEAHYRDRPLDADAECFYYAILAYERSFAADRRAPACLERAATAFRAYRKQTGPDFRWDVVDDRYADVLGELARLKKGAGA